MKLNTWIESPLGPMLLLAEGDTLIGSYFQGQAHFPSEATWGQSEREYPLFFRAQAELQEVAQGGRTEFSVPYRLRGTPFQLAVWQALIQVPFGQTLTYAELAARLGRVSATRAVAAALGRNPLCWFVPCHRVIGKGGGLTGYAGGLEKKQTLLAWEQAALTGSLSNASFSPFLAAA